MTLDEITDAIRQLDDQDFNALSDAMFIMGEERRARPAMEQAKQAAEAETATKIAQQLADEHPELVEKPTETTDGEVRDWEPWHPLKADTHYRYGDKTRHNGHVWRDVLDPTGATLNVWEPVAHGIDERYWEIVEPNTRTSMPAAEDTDTSSAPAQPAEDGTREWEPGLDAKTGDKLTYKGVTYTVRQPHTTAAHWLPDTLPALYQPA